MDQDHQHNEHTEEVDLEIPDNVAVGCPLHNCYVLVASTCNAPIPCPNFAGLYGYNKINAVEKLPFRRRFAVRCQHPQMLEMIELKI